MCRIEAKVNRMALDRIDAPAPLADNVELPLANMQDVDNLEAALKEQGYDHASHYSQEVVSSHARTHAHTCHSIPPVHPEAIAGIIRFHKRL